MSRGYVKVNGVTQRVLAVHKLKESPFSMTLCSPFGYSEKHNRIVSTDDDEVTCKQCLKKMDYMREREEVVM